MHKGTVTGKAKGPPTARLRNPMPRPRGEFGFSVPEAGKMIGLSIGSAYKAARAGEIPTVRIGSLLVVPRAAWLKKLGIEAVEENSAA
jgi:hypothetical protein